MVSIAAAVGSSASTTAAVSSKSVKAVAVLYSNKGGLAEVGKCVLAHALKYKATVDNEFRIVAVCIGNSQCDPTKTKSKKNGTETVNESYSEPTLSADSKNEAREQIAQTVLPPREFTTVNVNVDNPSAQSELEAAFAGCDAVISAFGNRQLIMPRFLADGMRATVYAMQAKGLRRLVLLSSIGVGGGHVPWSAGGALWAMLLQTVLRSVYKDILAMEAILASAGSALDYTIVRADALCSGSVGTVAGNVRGVSGLDPSKSSTYDAMASFMFRQAVPGAEAAEIEAGKCPGVVAVAGTSV